MKEQENKELDFFIKKAIGDLELDKVSSNFNNTLFQRIKSSENIAINPKPLIPKTIWWVLAVIFAGLIYTGTFLVEGNPDFWLFSLKYNTIGSFDRLNLNMNEVKWNSTIYAMFGLIIFIVFQVLILKQYFSKRRVII